MSDEIFLVPIYIQASILTGTIYTGVKKFPMFMGGDMTM